MMWGAILSTLGLAYRSMCYPCQRGEHYDCTEVAPTRDGGCHCRCTGYVCCPTCGSDVVLFSEDEPGQDDPTGIASGHCCHWMWADWWEGTFRYDLSQSDATAAVGANGEGVHTDGDAS